MRVTKNASPTKHLGLPASFFALTLIANSVFIDIASLDRATLDGKVIIR